MRITLLSRLWYFYLTLTGVEGDKMGCNDDLYVYTPLESSVGGSCGGGSYLKFLIYLNMGTLFMILYFSVQ